MVANLDLVDRSKLIVTGTINLESLERLFTTGNVDDVERHITILRDCRLSGVVGRNDTFNVHSLVRFGVGTQSVDIIDYTCHIVGVSLSSVTLSFGRASTFAKEELIVATAIAD